MDIAYCEQQLQRLVEEKQIDRIATFINEKDASFLLQKANELQANTFVFDKTWDMERCKTPYTLDCIDWNVQRNEDEEWCFMLNRMDYLNYVMLAGTIYNEKKYFETGKGLILDWIAQHKHIVPMPSTRTIDTGIRLMNIMEALPYLYAYQMIDKEELQCIVESMHMQIQYLKEAYLTKYTLSNWGSMQTCAIISCMPLLKEAYQDDPIFQWAVEELRIQLDIQVYDDGLHWEQSTMYHVEVFVYGMKALYYQRLYGFKFPKSIQTQVYKLCDALLYQATPKLEIETFGDSDRVCISDVFTKGASLFLKKEWKHVAFSHFDIESLYSFGGRYAKNYVLLAAQQPTSNTFDGYDSGMFTIRSSWEHDANFTMFTNGSLGSGHGHSDNLHVSLYRKGIPILIDAGRFTYREDHPLRVQLKRMISHNIVLVDGKENSLPKDSWGYSDFGIPLKTYAKHCGAFHYIEASFLGHDPLQIWTRKMIVLDCGIWLFVDDVKEDGPHEMKTYFHLDPNINIKDDVLQTQDGLLKMNIVGSGHKHIEHGPCSLRYNEVLDHTVVSYTKHFVDRIVSSTYVCDQEVQVEKVNIYQNNEHIVETDLGQALKFIVSEKESYTIVVFHKEIYKGKKICFCEGMPFHGKCVVIHEKNGDKDCIRLRT